MSAYGNAAVAQSVERRIGSAEVTGPIPVSSSFLCQKSLSDNLILFWLFFFLTGNKMINEKIAVSYTHLTLPTN